MDWKLLPANTQAQDYYVSFDTLIQAIWDGSPVKCSKCIFADEIDFRSLRFFQALVFEDCVFEKHVDATDARFDKSLTFKKCTFYRSLTLQFAKVNGSLILEDSTIHWPERSAAYTTRVDLEPFQPPPRFRSALWEGVQIYGSLEADRLRVYGSLDLGHSDIRGAINMRGVKIGLDPSESEVNYGGRVYLRQAFVDGDIEMEPSIDEDPDSQGYENTEIHGSLSIGASEIRGRLNIRGIAIQGCLHAITVNIKGRVLAGCWQHPTSKSEDTTVVESSIGTHTDGLGSSLLFQDATVDEVVWLHGLETTGSVEFDNARIGSSLDLGAWTSKIADSKEFRCSKIGCNANRESLVIKNARISANVVLDGAYLEGRVAGQNCYIDAAFLCRPRKDPLKREPKRPSIGCNGDGKSMSLYGAQIASTFDLSGAMLKGAVRLRSAKIGSVMAKRWEGEDGKEACDKSVATIIGNAIECDGEGNRESLYLYGAEVDGNVCFQDVEMSGTLSLELAKVHGSLLLDKSLINYPSSMTPPKWQSSVVGLNLKRSRIHNDVSLNGTQIQGDLSGSGCHILGSLKAAVTVESGEEPAKNPKLLGRFDLSESEVIGDIDLQCLEVRPGTSTSKVREDRTPSNPSQGLPQDPSERSSINISLQGSRLGSLKLALYEDESCANDKQSTFDLEGVRFDELTVKYKVDELTGERKPGDRTRSLTGLDWRELITGGLLTAVALAGGGQLGVGRVS